MKKIFSAYALLVCSILLPRVEAASIGGLAGYSWYRAPDDNLHGIKLRGCVDIPAANFVISPGLSYWIGGDGGDRLYDLTESLACKYYLISRQERIAPYFGIELALHILIATLPTAHFGIHGLLGTDINLSDKLRVSIKSSYGNVFAYNANIHTFTGMIGLATAF